MVKEKRRCALVQGLVAVLVWYGPYNLVRVCRTRVRVSGKGVEPATGMVEKKMEKNGNVEEGEKEENYPREGSCGRCWCGLCLVRVRTRCGPYEKNEGGRREGR